MDGGANTKAFYGTTCLALNVNITPVVVYSDIETQKVLLLKDNKGKSGVYNPNYVKLLRTPLSLFLSYPALPAKIKIKRDRPAISGDKTRSDAKRTRPSRLNWRALHTPPGQA